MVEKKKILLVDDDEDDREMFFEALKELNDAHTCVSMENGEKAMQYLNLEKDLPDIIFLDLNMPRLNGKQCLVEIQKSERLRNIPVIIYSTTRRSEDVEETRRLGAVDFLTKPPLFSQISEAISDVLGRVLFPQSVN